MSSVAPAHPQPAPAASRPAAPAFPIDEERLSRLAEALGGRLHCDAYGPNWAAPSPTTPGVAGIAAGTVTPLLDLGLLAAEGPQALSFLHSQLTQDAENLPPDEARWFGYCNPKGRLQASLLGWRTQAPADAPGVHMALSAGLTDALRRRLSMFVLRARLKLHDRSAEHLLFGLAGERAATWLSARLGNAPGPMQVIHTQGMTAIGLGTLPVDEQGHPVLRTDATTAQAGQASDRTLSRWLLQVPLTQAAERWSALNADPREGGAGLQALSAEHWRWLEVLGGIPRILPGTWEHFVPQMINFELVGGVNFRKGCYPGQEVVARSQYLGKLKRRMFLGVLDSLVPAPGADLVPAAGGEPCGEVVMAARGPDGRVALLFESQIAAVSAPLTVGGETVAIAHLPYPVPAPG